MAWARRYGWITALLMLSACRQASPVPSADDLKRAESARPSDRQLAQKYERSCQACHAIRGSAAPLTGYTSDWHARLKQGMTSLVAHARDGYQAMPARGYCNDCSDEDFAALIRFMSSAAAKEGA